MWGGWESPQGRKARKTDNLPLISVETASSVQGNKNAKTNEDSRKIKQIMTLCASLLSDAGM